MGKNLPSNLNVVKGIWLTMIGTSFNKAPLPWLINTSLYIQLLSWAPELSARDHLIVGGRQLLI